MAHMHLRRQTNKLHLKKEVQRLEAPPSIGRWLSRRYKLQRLVWVVPTTYMIRARQTPARRFASCQGFLWDGFHSLPGRYHFLIGGGISFHFILCQGDSTSFLYHYSISFLYHYFYFIILYHSDIIKSISFLYHYSCIIPISLFYIIPVSLILYH